MQQTHIQVFQASLARATQATDFYQRFYEQFMHGKHDASVFFKNKDMQRIQKKLKMTLEMVADHASGRAGLDMYFDMLGKMHERLHIHSEFFAQWQTALIATASVCDPQFSEEIQQAWERVIEDVIDKMGETAHQA